MRHETPLELRMFELDHLWEIEVIFEQLLTHIMPQSWLPGPKYFSNVRSIGSIIANDVRVEFPRDRASEAPIKKQRVEYSHSHKVES